MLYKRITSSWRPRRPITGQISLCPPISIIPNTAERLRSVPSTKTQQELRQVTATKPGVFQVEAIRQHLHSKKYHGAGDLTGIQMREKMYVLFETDDSDEELHSLLFTYCMYYSSSTPRYKLAIQSDQARLAYSFDWRRWSRWRRRMMSPICHE